MELRETGGVRYNQAFPLCRWFESATPTMYYMKKKKKKKDDCPLFDAVGIKVKKKPDLTKKLDKVFSEYIRLRDTMPNGYFRCISCGQIKPYSKADAGHYHSRRHMSTRWDEDNVHAECSYCNRFSADHLDKFRENLIRKIGEAAFERLKFKSTYTTHWLDFELEEKIKYYKEQIKLLKEEKHF